MQSHLAEVTYDIQLKPGESLTLPPHLDQIVGPGHWVVSIRPAGQQPPSMSIRDHAAFLSSYAPEDEGLYDDYPSR
jgi:hypothetical protein